MSRAIARLNPVNFATVLTYEKQGRNVRPGQLPPGKKAQAAAGAGKFFAMSFQCTINAYSDFEETMTADPIRDQGEARYHILAYLLDNPDAGDTFEGIVEWWLLHQKVKFETQAVSEAVARLVADGLIVEQKGSDSRVIYRVNRTRQNIKTELNQIRTSPRAE